MEKLPQEIIDRISSFLTVSDLRQTLTVSQQFQHAAERSSGAFESFELRATDASTQKLFYIFAGRRFRYLRRIHLRTELPRLQYGRKEAKARFDPGHRETKADLVKKDLEFTSQISSMFAALKRLETRANELQLGPGRIHLSVWAPTRARDSGYCLHWHLISWRIQLLSPEKLPCLDSIYSLAVEGQADMDLLNEPSVAVSKLNLRIMIELASQLPNLQHLECRIGGEEWVPNSESAAVSHFFHDAEGCRRDSRHNFAEALTKTELPNSMRSISLDFMSPARHMEDVDQRGGFPDLVAPATRGDPFSSSLRVLSYQLRHLELHGILDETIFWPTDNATTNPTWPNLESLSVHFYLASPSGAWYFCGPDNDGRDTESYRITSEMYPPLTSTDSDYEWDMEKGDSGLHQWEGVAASFRVCPIEETLTPFLKAFTKAAQAMTKLRYAMLWTSMTWAADDVSEAYDSSVFDAAAEISTRQDARLAWGIAFAQAGEEAFSTSPGLSFAEDRQIWWKMGGWRPAPDLHREFQQIGAGRGAGLMEYWRDGEFGNGLVVESLFSQSRFLKGLRRY
ncbi:hypothetical protein OPT61_g6082 [Boeremia exigua]|uniref:Uncharacterized protein n=1 Tax=Boeremia exigua TaxID=749465 RepID=A0ACC2I7Z3_9PLEO|nr:hypothetical protein OPT61_g6082 [Boeremia exigua]